GSGVFWLGMSTDTNPPPAPAFWLSIVDLSRLPALSVAAQSAASTSSLGWNVELEPVWLKPDLLVWAARANQFSSSWGGAFPGGPILLTWFWGYPAQNNGGRLLAFDVSDP